MVKVNISKLSNFKALGNTTFSTMVKVKVIKPSDSKAFWNTGYQNFFNHGEGKGIQTMQL